MLLAIDPGNTQSAYCLLDKDRKPVEHGKVPNEQLMEYVRHYRENHPENAYRLDAVVIEMVASYGMAVGKEVFWTCVMVGRLTEAAESIHVPVDYIYRMEEKMTLCHDSRAKDTNIRQALIDRYAKHDLKNGKGTKQNPDWFYGFANDTWSAYAVGISWLDKQTGTVKKPLSSRQRK